MLWDEDAANGEMSFPVMIRGEAIQGVSPTYCVPVIAIYLLLLYYDCCVDIMRAEGCRGTFISISLNSGGVLQRQSRKLLYRFGASCANSDRFGGLL